MTITINGEEIEIPLNTINHVPSVIRWFEECCNHIIVDDILPEKYPEPVLKCFNIRNIYTDRISWCLLAEPWVNVLAEKMSGKKCIELYAGLGYLSHNLQKRGVDITPYDDKSWAFNKYKKACEVVNMKASDAIKKYRNQKVDYVLMSWIPYDPWDSPNLRNSDCVKVLKEIKHHHPETKLIIIGEENGGCNANDVFFSMINETYFDKELDSKFQQWYGIHDIICEYKVK